MIKPNELRLFNYVQWKGKIGRVMEIWDTKILCRVENNVPWHFQHGKYEGIPLTEDWLIKFGFVEDYGMRSWRNDIDTDVQIVYETLAGFFRIYPRTNKIEFVHQLQNLFFALTGEELTLK